MTLGLIYWLIIIIGVILALMSYGPVWLSPAVHFVLFVILGWQLFGAPIQRGSGTPTA